jgi:hypothetical protein
MCVDRAVEGTSKARLVKKLWQGHENQINQIIDQTYIYIYRKSILHAQKCLSIAGYRITNSVAGPRLMCIGF